MRSSNRLPTRFPDGAKYVLESDGGMVRRFVEFPDGRRVALPARKAMACCPEVTEVSLVPSVTDTPAPGRRAPRRTVRALAHA